MAEVRLLPGAIEDLERIVTFLREADPVAAGQTATLIFNGLRVLKEHPLIGRSIRTDRRELVVFRGCTGYLVQYHYAMATEEVLVLAIRHQREVEG